VTLDRFSATLFSTVPETGRCMPDNDAPITALRLTISGAELSLGRGDHVIGRASECAVFIEDPLASRRHAVLTVGDERVTIRDLGSRNGVLVNGSDVADHHVLAEGDLIMIGSQAMVVAQICRAGQLAPARPIDKPIKPTALGRMKVQKRAPLDTSAFADALATGNTTLSQVAPLGLPAGALRMIAEAADRAIATHRPEKAEKILEVPLTEVLDTLRAGQDVEGEIIDIAVEEALRLVEITPHDRWVDYVHGLYDLLRMPMPLAVADRLVLAVQRKKKE
jgi:pSer/pThr/pTyr-binding forkhead associated (FHA) protein